MKALLSSSIVRAVIQIAICAAPGVNVIGCAVAAAGLTLGAGGTPIQALKAFATTLVSAAVWAWEGDVTTSKAFVLSTGGGSGTSAATVLVHGVVGGALSVAQGGSFLQGSASGAIGEVATMGTSGFGGSQNLGLRLAVVSAAGGLASQLTGGKFANGALTAGFAYLFNYLQHARDLSPAEGKAITDEAAEWQGTPYARSKPYSGDGAEKQMGADCSGSTWKVYQDVGDNYTYTNSKNFDWYAATEGFPFRKLDDGEAMQKGDVILFKGHMAIYNGDDSMWTARTSKNKYINGITSRFGSAPLGYYRYQLPTGN